ncbi:MAG: hypothetical protein JW867_06530 [Candidatus Omnitrophica bacterium]|nr:hypothetical protein [Candidatus Omnitrophota bacterium]
MPVTDKKIYQFSLKLGLPRESALNLILVKRGLKDATTINYSKKICAFLKKNQYKFEIDESYLKEKVHGFLEYTTKVPLFDAPLIKRLYVGKKISRAGLKQLKSGTNFDQGLAFGFPICDVLNYCKKSKKEGKSYIDIFKDWLSDLPDNDGFKFLDFRFFGGLVKYFRDIRIIVHIPHSPDCIQSLEMADRNLSILKELDSSFYETLIYEFTRPLLIYGDRWRSFSMIQFDGIEKLGTGRYRGRCLKAINSKVAANTELDIKLLPHKKVEIFLKDKKVDKSTSSASIPWSYVFLVATGTQPGSFLI